MLKRYLEAGQIVSTHGLNGEVRVMPWCDSPEFLTGFDTFYRSDGQNTLNVRSARIQKNLVLMRFEGVDDIDAAMKLLKTVLYIDRHDVELPEGSYFEQDMIGLQVLDYETGACYGTLTEVSQTGANDVYTVKRPEGDEVLIPAIRDVIRSVDPEGGRMLITPLKGLFEDED